MSPRLASLALAALLVLTLPRVGAEPTGVNIPPPGPIGPLLCLYVDPGPPPNYAVEHCHKALVGVMVNGTDDVPP